MDQLCGENAGTGQIVNDHRDVDLRKVGEVLPQHFAVPSLLDVIQLVDQSEPGLLDRADQIQLSPDVGVLFERLGDVGEDLQFLQHLFADVGPLHFDHHFASIPQNRAMHLAERCRSHRRRLECGEHLRNFGPQLLLHDPLDVGEGEWLDAVLQRLQRDDVLRRDDVGTRREDLAELDVGRPHLLERLGERHGTSLDVRLDLLCFGFGEENLFRLRREAEVLASVLSEKNEQIAICADVPGLQH